MLETIKSLAELYYNTIYILLHFCKYYFEEKTLDFRLAWKSFWRSLGLISEWDDILDSETVQDCQ